MRKSAVVRRYLTNPSLLLLSLAAMLLTPAAAEAGGVHPRFNIQSVSQSPFPSDRFTVPDPGQRTNLRVNLPSPDCASRPSDCLDVALLNQLDGFNTQPRISIPFDGAIDPGTVTSRTSSSSASGTSPTPPTSARRPSASTRWSGTRPRSHSSSSRTST